MAHLNYGERQPVEGESFRSWGELWYRHPLTEQQMSDYELRPARDNPEAARLFRIVDTPGKPRLKNKSRRPGGWLLKNGSIPPTKNCPRLGRPIGGFVWKKDITR